jgi:hypothetical protein
MKMNFFFFSFFFIDFSSIFFRMSKASKHAHTQPFMRASELAELGAFYGTTKQRLGKDSQRAWNLCNLTLTEIKDDEAAVVTPEGVLYSREALLQSMIAQKKKYKVALAAYKEYQERVKSEEQRKEREKALEEQRAFEKESVAKKQKTAVKPDYFRAERAGVEAAGPVKPRKGAFCPVTGSKLKLAQLHDVHMSKSCRSCKRDFTNGSVVSLLAPR